MSKAKLKLLLLELRVPFFTASIAPVVLGAAIAWARGNAFHWGYFFLTLVGMMALHAGANVSNDYFDHLSGNDEVNVEFVSPFTGGSRMIQQGLLTPREVFWEFVAAYALAAAIGLVLAYFRGPMVLVLGAIGILSGLLYTAPLLRIVSTGLGEVAIGLNFGVLSTLGAYYVQTGKLSWEPVIASLPVALLIAAVLYINEFQDMKADAAVGKNHLVVRLGRRWASFGYLGIMLATYLSLVLGVGLGPVSAFGLIALATLPLAWKAVRTALTHYDDPIKLVPANANTILVHALTGLLMTVGYVLARVF